MWGGRKEAERDETEGPILRSFQQPLDIYELNSRHSAPRLAAVDVSEAPFRFAFSFAEKQHRQRQKLSSRTHKGISEGPCRPCPTAPPPVRGIAVEEGNPMQSSPTGSHESSEAATAYEKPQTPGDAAVCRLCALGDAEGENKCHKFVARVTQKKKKKKKKKKNEDKMKTKNKNKKKKKKKKKKKNKEMKNKRKTKKKSKK
ncbi:hypothetical protein EYF80_032234 [Liparis tanakae]|uniref:Uncharacterized protein n=1 Tax=Liparis tanakae TaxID=230148 RepID=A0A4Z2GW93_9TELE|nr:hypothetical protein EYF80_032234 [Liparis tanakae]